MFILQLIQRTEFPDGTPIPEAAKPKFAAAAIEFMALSMLRIEAVDVELGEKCINTLKNTEISASEAIVQDTMKVAESAWLQRAMTGLAHYASAVSIVQASGCPSGVTRNLTGIWHKVVIMLSQCIIMNSGESASAPWSLFVIDPMLYLHDCMQFGVFDFHDLATAYALRYAKHRDYDFKEPIKSNEQLIEMVQLDNSADVMVAASLYEEALRLSDMGETLAAEAKAAELWNDVCQVTYESLLNYDITVTLFDWAIARYQKLGMALPKDIMKERQVNEEIRVELECCLESTGYSMIYLPLSSFQSHDSMAEAKMVPTLADKASQWVFHVDSYYGKAPFFPDSLFRNLKEHAPAFQSRELHVLEPMVRNILLASFPDSYLVRICLQASDQWSLYGMLVKDVTEREKTST